MKEVQRYPTRREAIRAGVTAGFGLALGHAPLAARLARTQAQPLITRPIPASGEQLPVVGIGTNQYGVNTPEEMAPLCDVLRRLPELGGKVVDTARQYGRSEEVIGECVRRIGNRDQLFISTKYSVGGRGDAPLPDAATARRGLEEAFSRLHTNTIDLMLVHNLGGTELLLPLLRELKQAGRVRYLGISTSSDRQYEPLMGFMRTEPLDFIQVDYSIGNRNAEQAILPLAQEKGIAVLVNMPFGGRRATVLQEVAGRELPDFAAEVGATSWPQLFLKYVVAHPAVTAVIPGTRKVQHLEDNLAAAHGVLPDAALRQRIEAYYDALPRG